MPRADGWVNVHQEQPSGPQSSAMPACTANMLVDSNKVFEHVDHRLLVRKARELGYPMHFLRTGARRPTHSGYAFQPLWPTRDIAAGSSTATSELWLLAAPDLRVINRLHPRVILSLHVGDLSASTTADTVEECTAEVVRLAQTIKLEFQTNRGPTFAQDKDISYHRPR
jgi:hypothetical protein